MATGREALFAEDGIRSGGPDAVIEVRSPNDENYEKLPLFSKLGVCEVIIIDRDTKRVDVFRLAASEYERREAAADGRSASARWPSGSRR